jgi:hypothetical protein
MADSSAGSLPAEPGRSAIVWCRNHFGLKPPLRSATAGRVAVHVPLRSAGSPRGSKLALVMDERERFAPHEALTRRQMLTTLLPSINSLLRHGGAGDASDIDRARERSPVPARVQSSTGTAASLPQAGSAVDGTLSDSFPASDPPSWNPGAAIVESPFTLSGVTNSRHERRRDRRRHEGGHR